MQQDEFLLDDRQVRENFLHELDASLVNSEYRAGLQFASRLGIEFGRTMIERGAPMEHVALLLVFADISHHLGSGTSV